MRRVVWLAFISLVGSGVVGLIVFAIVLLVRTPRTSSEPPPRPIRTWDQALVGVLVKKMSQSPDGRAFAWFGFDIDQERGCIEVGLFSTTDGKRGPSRRLKGEAYALAWSPDSSLLAVAAEDEPVLLLDGGDLSVVGTLGEARRSDSPGFVLAFSPDGGSLAAGDWGCGVEVWELRTKTPRPAMQMPIPPTHLAYSRDGSRLAAATRSEVVVWDIAANAPAWSFRELHQDPETECCGITGLFWSGERLVTTGVDGVVRLWDIGAKKLARAFQPEVGDCRHGSPATGGKFLLLAGGDNLIPPQDGTCFLMSLTSGVITQYFSPYEGEIVATAISPLGDYVYVATVRAEKNDPFSGAVYRFPVKPNALREE